MQILSACFFQQRGFAFKADHTGMHREKNFDYSFESKLIHKERWQHNYRSFMKTLGEDYDIKSEQHTENMLQMNRLNLELQDRIEEVMNITQDVEKKIHKKNKKTAKERVHGLLDAGSPFLSIAQLAGYD